MEIKQDKRNYRKHNEKNKELIKKSLSECGAGRSIVIDNENEIIAGNGIYEQAKKLGLKTKVIETDGSELVVVKRTDLATDDEKRKQLAVMDNSTSDSSEFDIEALNNDFEIDTLNEWGMELEPNFNLMEQLEDNIFRDNIINASDTFAITFYFPSQNKEMILNAINKISKPVLTNKIIEILNKDK